MAPLISPRPKGELYLEGDIVFRQGERIIYAESMYYNINSERGMVLNAEAITTIPEYLGIVRLKADVLQQVARGNFIAFDAAVTSSRMGVPRYWLQSERLQLTDRQRIMPDPVTGIPMSRSEPFVNSSDNFVYFGGVPILYWPTFSTSLGATDLLCVGRQDSRTTTSLAHRCCLTLICSSCWGSRTRRAGVDWDLSTRLFERPRTGHRHDSAVQRCPDCLASRARQRFL